LTTQAWFDYNLQKIVSVTAGIASAYFTNALQPDGPFAVFDSRAFNLPKEEVCNYFVWRQQDWTKNSIQMLARAYFSHKELHGKKTSDLHDMLHSVGVNWNDIDPMWKNGSFLYKTKSGFKTSHTTIFTKDKEAINKYLEPKEE
jgi:tRNA(His) 5'-end guanylyltransferase